MREALPLAEPGVVVAAQPRHRAEPRPGRGYTPRMLLVLVACATDPGPATAGSRSAELAAEAAQIAVETRELERMSHDLDGWVDQWRLAPEAERATIEGLIQERAYDLQDRALRVQARVTRLEAAARVEGAPRPAEPADER